MKSKLKFYHYKKGLVNRSQFIAGNKDLNKYIQDLMPIDESRNLSRNYVGLDEDGHFVSLLCLFSHVITAGEALNSDKQLSPGMDKPTIKIGRLVVDERYRSKGYGKQTIEKAIRIFVEVSKQIGVIGLTVDAKKGVEDYYKKKCGFGFVEYGSPKKDSIPLILFTETLKKTRPSLFENPV